MLARPHSKSEDVTSQVNVSSLQTKIKIDFEEKYNFPESISQLRLG
jgi:hypothetical protein